MAALNVTQKIIQSHLVDGKMIPGGEISLKIDQTLCQDATGTLVMLELEAMELDRVKTKVSAQYVDHNLIQEDYKNADDHLFLQSAARRFGVWYSRPGNGVSHPLHMQWFGKPGEVMIGSDSHTCAGGALGMLAIGAGGLEVAMAMCGHPYNVTMPKVLGVKLFNKLPKWVSAKDVILELLRRRGVKGAVNCVIEYYGPGLKQLSVWDRHVIANMGAELGATGTVFPADDITKQFLKAQGRQKDWISLTADEFNYDISEEINLAKLEPLIALPSSPGNVVPVKKVKGRDIYQSYIGSSANPGFRDFAISAMMVKNKFISPNVSFDINPATRNILEELADTKLLGHLVHSGARIHQAGCNGCIGMGQAPATRKNSLRTVPRNFPGRSGTKEDLVFLCSPETATASALKGVITDPRDLKMNYPKVKLPKKITSPQGIVEAPLTKAAAQKVQLVKGPNIVTLPKLKPLPLHLELTILLKVGDNISTDEILPAGARVLPFRSNIPKISEFAFDIVDETYSRRAKALRDKDKYHAIIGGENYGQGSSREHAALAPRFLGLRMVIAKSFARIHWENLVNFGVLPLTFTNAADYEELGIDDVIAMEDVVKQLKQAEKVEVRILNKDKTITLQHRLSERQIDIIEVGGLINWAKHTS